MNLLEKLVEKVVLYKFKKTLLSLNDDEKIKFVKELLNHFYELNLDLTDEFYRFCLSKIEKNDLSVFSKENIFLVIDEYRSSYLYVDDLELIITPKQYLDVPVRHLNKIKELLLDKLHTCPKSRLDKLYEEEDLYKLARQAHFLDVECVYLAYKLYLSVGFNNTIELLQNRFGNISFATLYFLFYPIEVKKMDNPNEKLISFLFSGEKRDCVMYLILSGNSKELFLNFSYFYENFFYYNKMLRGNLTKKRVEELLKDRFLSFNPIYPDVRRDVVSDMVASFAKQYNHSYTDQDIQNINYHYYEENMIKLVSSSIPQIHLEVDDLQMDVLAKSDPKILVMGYRSGNCLRINGEAAVLFSFSVKSKDFRLVSISSSQDNDIAMMLVARNGNVLIAQGIEISKSYQDYYKRRKIYQAATLFMKKLMDEMNKRGDLIVLSVMGCSNSNVTDFNNNILPFRVSPNLGEYVQTFYNGFQFPQVLIAWEKDKNYCDIKLFLPTQEYYDEREEVICLNKDDYGYLRGIVRDRLMSISYQAATYKKRLYMQSHHETKEIYCNKDWYLIVFEDGQVDGTYLEYDYRAKEEYEFYLHKLTNDFKRERKN